jgi:hypothetical protein
LLRKITEDSMTDKHPKVPATAENCEEDHQAKLALNDDFEDFKKKVLDAANKSTDIKNLVVPLLPRLENSVILAAHGRHLVPVKADNKHRP